MKVNASMKIAHLNTRYLTGATVDHARALDRARAAQQALRAATTEGAQRLGHAHACLEDVACELAQAKARQASRRLNISRKRTVRRHRNHWSAQNDQKHILLVF